jgi:hypothetical protein
MIETITFVAVNTGTIVRTVVGRNSVEAMVAAAMALLLVDGFRSVLRRARRRLKGRLDSSWFSPTTRMRIAPARCVLAVGIDPLIALVQNM